MSRSYISSPPIASMACSWITLVTDMSFGGGYVLNGTPCSSRWLHHLTCRLKNLEEGKRPKFLNLSHVKDSNPLFMFHWVR
jgi:hypothetical protein